MNIIWIHGFGENGQVWESFLPHLPQMLRHYNFDHSEATGTASIQDYAENLQDFIQEKKINSPVLIGHSMGGYIALEYAALYPQKVKGLGLFHSSATADSSEKQKEREKTAEFILKHGSPAFIENFYPKMFAQPDKFPDLIEKNIHLYSQIPAQALADATLSMKERRDHVNTLSQFSFPIFQILGKSDPFVPLDKALAQTALLQHPYTLVLDDAAHAGMFEQTEICSQFITNYLQQLS
jgi:pimeloyl-ACP methyl ester carboxylesterase